MYRLSTFLWVVCSLIAITGNTQNLRFQSQKVHSSAISAMAFTPDSKLVFTSDEAGEIIAWKVPEGVIYRHYHDRYLPVEDMVVTADGKTLIACGTLGDPGEITAWEIASGKKLFSITQYNAKKLLIPNGSKNFLAFIDHEDYREESICIEYDITGKKVRQFKIPYNANTITAVVSSPDGTKTGIRASVEEYEHAIFSIDNKTGKASAHSHTTKSEIIQVTNTGEVYTVEQGNDVVAIGKWNAEKEDWDNVTDVKVTSAALFIQQTEAGESGYSVYNPVTAKNTTVTVPGLFGILHTEKWKISPNGKCLITNQCYYGRKSNGHGVIYQALIYWNLNTGAMIWGNNCLYSPVYSLDAYGDGKIIMGKEGPMEVWDPARADVYTEYPGGTEGAQEIYAAKDSRAVYITFGQSSAMVNPEKASVESHTEDGRVSISRNFSMGAYSTPTPESGYAISLFDPETLREKGSLEFPHRVVWKTALSADGKNMAALLDGNDSLAEIKVCETFSKKAFAEFTVPVSEGGFTTLSNIGMVFSEDGKFLAITSLKKTVVFDVRLKTVVKTISCFSQKAAYDKVAIHPQSKNLVIAGMNGDVFLFDGTWKAAGTLEGCQGSVTGMTYIEEGRLLVLGYQDGSVRIYDMEKKKLAATFLGEKNGDYLLFTPDGYYTGIGKGLELAGFYQGENFISRQTMDSRFNRPDTVMARLGVAGKQLMKMYVQAVKKKEMRVPPKTLSTSATVRPVVTAENKEEMAYVTSNAVLKYNAVATDASGLTKLTLFQNGVKIKTIPLTGTTQKVPVQLDLRPENNKIEMVAENNKGVESSYDVLYVYREVKETEKPQLYILSVGVSEFADKERNLDYAAKDAKEIAGAFEQSPAFSKVNTVVIRDKEVTRENLKKQVAFLQKAKPNDVIILFISSHGVLDEKMDYFLATNDMNFSEPSGKGIPYYEIEEMMRELPCHNRMILMDACHSGEVEKEEAELVKTTTTSDAKVTTKSGQFSIQPKLGLKNSFNYMHTLFQDISSVSGTHIIGAASGYQVAFESGEWNNGAFTFAMKAGLTNGAADQDKNGQVTVSELQSYLRQTVPALTDGQQTPSLRSVNRDNDFRLW